MNYSPHEFPRSLPIRNANDYVTTLIDAYRRTGADRPWGDPMAPHGVAMEGWFWRITDPARGRVAVVLCGSCRGASGDWTLVGLAAEPGGLLRSAICPPLEAASDGRTLTVPGGALTATPGQVRVDLGEDARLDARIAAPVGWPPRAYGALGLGHAVPRLGQYWFPHVLGASVDGTLRLDGADWRFDDAIAYAEKNWGNGFPNRWWWGQASGIGDDREACVAFAGGDVRVGPLAFGPTAVVARAGDAVVRLGPPFARVRTETSDRALMIRARSARLAIEIEADASGSSPHALPVPVPDDRRVVDGASQHFIGRLRLTVRRGRRLVLAGESELAALERGDLTG